MILFVLLSLCFALRQTYFSIALSTDLPTYFTNCAESTSILQLDYIHINPDPPVKGKQLHIEGRGILTDRIDAGSLIHYKVKLGFITLVDKTEEFCEVIKQVGEKCPFEKGVFSISKDIEIPNQLPNGVYKLEVEVYLKDKRQVACLKGSFKL